MGWYRCQNCAENIDSGLYDGGLKLVDFDIKRKAIRIKTVKKYLYDSLDYVWKHFFKVYLDESGGCEDNGLLMGLKRKMCEKVPDFYKEVIKNTEVCVNVN